MNLALYFLLVLQLHCLTLTSASESPMMLPSAACTDELVIFSSCLPFIGASPNNRTEFPPPQCCDDISSSFANGSAICICYLILQPEILGFPLDSTKLLSLTFLCQRPDQISDNFSLLKLCSDSAVLPPLHGVTGSNNQKPHNATVAGIPPPQESSVGIPSTESSGGIPSVESTGIPLTEQPYQESSSIPSPATHKMYCLSCLAFFLLLCFSIRQQQIVYVL